MSSLTIKLVTVGNVGVGKTCVITRFHTGEYQEEYLVTIGAHFYSKELEMEGEKVKVQIWDTAGQEQYHSITTSYFKNTAAALLVYDVSSRSSFEDIQVWLNELKQNSHEGVAITLIGNKCDMPEDKREVSEEEGRQFADKNRMQFFECSAKDGTNIEQIFEETTSEVLARIKQGVIVPDDDYSNGVRLNSGLNKSQFDYGRKSAMVVKKKGGCC